MKNSTSFCDQTFPGWTHDVFGRNWACYYGRKDSDMPSFARTQISDVGTLKFSGLVKV